VRPPRGPRKVLRGFRRVALAAGSSSHVSLELAVADLGHYDAKSKRNVVDPGRYELAVGSSSSDRRLAASFDVVGP
jgi:beta-glucosidase